MIKTENLNELARLQEIKTIDLSKSSHPGLDFSSYSITITTAIDQYGNRLPHGIQSGVLTSESLKQIQSMVEKLYNQDLENRLSEAKKAVWNDISENGGI